MALQLGFKAMLALCNEMNSSFEYEKQKQKKGHD
jgi:hypothetical protein